MQTQLDKPQRRGGLVPAIVTFSVVIILLLVIAIMNAPTRGGPQVMASTDTYLAEVRKTAIPFLIAVGIGAVLLAGYAAVTVYREWPDRKRRNTLLTAYAFLSPYLLITLTFTIGVILFAFYISFTQYDIFTSPKWVGLQNYAKAFAGLTDPTQKDFIQSLYNVFWYTLIVVPIQTALALGLAVMLKRAYAREAVLPHDFLCTQRHLFRGHHVDLHVVLPEDRLYQLSFRQDSGCDWRPMAKCQLVR